MPSHWMLRDPLSMTRAVKLRWQTRNGFSVSDVPAFDAETDSWFRERIATVSHYVEFGSGASTILAARQGVRTISMESDPRYAKAVRAALPEDAPVVILDAKLGLTEYWGYPVATRQTEPHLESWLNYARQPLYDAAREGWTPDLVLVDGRFRCACALAAAQAVQLAGAKAEILFDDYAGRPYYSWIEQHLAAPQMVGRAALFTIGPDLSVEVSDALIAEAARDFR